MKHPFAFPAETSFRKGGVWVVALALAALSCGNDGVILFRTNLGAVDSDATCMGSGGQFPLRQQEGLIVLVILDDDSTVVLADGTLGACGALKAGIRVSVRGAADGDRIRAHEVHIL